MTSAAFRGTARARLSIRKVGDGGTGSARLLAARIYALPASSRP